MEPPAIPFSFSLTPEHEDMHPTATPSLHSFHTPTASSWTPLPHTPLYSPCGISWKDLSAKVHSSELLTGHHLLYTDSRPSMEIEDSIIANDDDHHNSMNTYNGMGGQGALSPVHAPSGQGSLSDSMCAEKASKPTAITGSLSQQLTEAISGRATHDEVCCPNMSAFSVYDSALQQHYMLPSETVVVTLGSIKYVTLFEKYGSQTRYKFQLCERYQHGACPDGSSCTYIHCVSVPNSTTVHDNENFIKSFRSSTFTAEELAGGKNTKGYATLRAGAVLDVYPPNDSNKAPQRIRSEHILRTAGALAAFEVRAAAHGLALGIEFMSLGSCTPLGERSPTAHSEAVKIRHCAHFQYKRMCHRGPSCSFIHSLVPYVQKLAPSLDSESSAHHTDCATPTCLIALTPSQSMSLTPLHGLGPAQGAVEIRTDKVPYGGQSTVWPDRPVPTITMLPPSIAAMAPPQAELHPPMNLGIPFPNTSPLASTASGASLVSLTPTSSTTLVSPLTLLAWPWGGPPLPPACVVGKPPVGYPMTTFPADPQLSAANGNGAAHLINAHNVGPALLWPH